MKTDVDIQVGETVDRKQDAEPHRLRFASKDHFDRRGDDRDLQKLFDTEVVRFQIKREDLVCLEQNDDVGDIMDDVDRGIFFDIDKEIEDRHTAKPDKRDDTAEDKYGKNDIGDTDKTVDHRFCTRKSVFHFSRKKKEVRIDFFTDIISRGA